MSSTALKGAKTGVAHGGPRGARAFSVVSSISSANSYAMHPAEGAESSHGGGSTEGARTWLRAWVPGLDDLCFSSREVLSSQLANHIASCSESTVRAMLHSACLLAVGFPPVLASGDHSEGGGKPTHGLVQWNDIRATSPPGLPPVELGSLENSLFHVTNTISGLWSPKDASHGQQNTLAVRVGCDALAASTASNREQRHTPVKAVGTAEVDGDGELVKICQFEVIAELGRGSYGAVSLAVDVTDGNSYAIKTMKRFVGGHGAAHGAQLAHRSLSSVSTASASASASASVSFSNPATPSGAKDVKPRLPSADGTEMPTAHVATKAQQAAAHPPKRGLAGVRAMAGKNRSALIEREIAVMKRLHHPNVVRLHAVIEDPSQGVTHLVMQYIENGPPTKMRPDGTCLTLPLERALHYMAQVSCGIDYLHEHGIVHRDVKPENILIGKDHVAYIADFGVSAIVADDGGGAPRSKASMVGTMAFFSPEMLERGERANCFGRQSDVWAFGVTLFAMIYGRLPFMAWSGPSLFRMVLNDPLTFPEAPSVPSAVKELLAALLSKDPQKRLTLSAFRHHPVVRQATRAPSGDTQPQGAEFGKGEVTIHVSSPSLSAEGSGALLPPDPVGHTRAQHPFFGDLGPEADDIRQSISEAELAEAVLQQKVTFIRRHVALTDKCARRVSVFASRIRGKATARRQSVAILEEEGPDPADLAAVQSFGAVQDSDTFSATFEPKSHANANANATTNGAPRQPKGVAPIAPSPPEVPSPPGRERPFPRAGATSPSPTGP